jgi:hypothetical protein
MVMVLSALRSPPPVSPLIPVMVLKLGGTPRLNLACAASLAPVPPSAIFRSEILFMLPPVILTALAFCVAIVPTVVVAPDASPRLNCAAPTVLAPVPPSAMDNGVIPVTVPPVIFTPLAFCTDIVPRLFTVLTTNSVVAICVVKVALAGVGAVGVPVNAGLVKTKAVVANCVVLVPGAAVGAVGVPVNAGLILLSCTNAVVAIWSLFVPGAAVGAVGVPIKAGPTVTNSVVAICVLAVPGAAVGASGCTSEHWTNLVELHKCCGSHLCGVIVGCRSGSSGGASERRTGFFTLHKCGSGHLCGICAKPGSGSSGCAGEYWIHTYKFCSGNLCVGGARWCCGRCRYTRKCRTGFFTLHKCGSGHLCGICAKPGSGSSGCT